MLGLGKVSLSKVGVLTTAKIDIQLLNGCRIVVKTVA